MRSLALLPVLALALGVNGSVAAAQQKVVVAPVTESVWSAPDIRDELTRLYEQAEWDSLQNRLENLLSSATLYALLNAESTDRSLSWTAVHGDWKRHQYIVAWPTTDLKHIAVVILGFPLPEPYTDVLPGLTPNDSLYEVLLIPKNIDEAKGQYTFASLPDPVETQITSVVNKVTEAVLGVFVRGTLMIPMAVKVSRVWVPFDRATIEAQYEFTRLEQVPRAKSPRTTVDETAKVRDPAGASVVVRTTTTTEVDTYRMSKEDSVTTTVRTISYKEGNPRDTIVDKTTVTNVVSAIPTKENTVKTKAVLQNSPKRSIDFGLLSGAVLGSLGGAERVKVDGGLLLADPLDRLLTMATINWYPTPYQPLAQSKTWPPRVRLSAGVVLTPEPGFGAALGVGLDLGLSLNLGAAGLAVNTRQQGDSLGVAPNNPADPVKTSIRWIWYAAVGFAFK